MNERRPTIDPPGAMQLVELVENFLESEAAPGQPDPKLRYRIRVAANLLRIARREMEQLPSLEVDRDGNAVAPGLIAAVGSLREFALDLKEGRRSITDPETFDLALRQVEAKLAVASPEVLRQLPTPSVSEFHAPDAPAPSVAEPAASRRREPMQRREGALSLGERLRQTAKVLGDAVAVRTIRGLDQYDEMSWTELDRQSEHLARRLLALGVEERPATVVLITRDAVRHAVYAYGAWKAGQTVLCLSPGLGSAEGQAILSRLGRTITLGAQVPWDTGEWLADELPPPGPVAPLEDRVAAPMLLITTGGSTGIPKLVDVIGPGLFVPGDFLGGLGTALKRRPRAKAFIMTPLSHGAGAATAYMATFEECEMTSLEKFDPETALWAIDRFKLEQITLVPTMMHRMLRSPAFDPARLESIRSLCHTGMQCDPEDKQAWMDAIGAEKVVEVWGSTESVGHAVIAGDEWITHRGSVGRPVNCRVRILDPAGNDLPVGEVGEIFVQPLVGSVDPDTKYFNSKQRMKSNNGYVSFGDLGRLDADGYLYIAGRTDDLIITGGANVYPDELEVLIRRLPGVADCVVVAKPHDDLGQSVHAVVAMEQGVAPPGLEELRQALTGKISAYKLPRSVEYVPVIQRTDAGKVRRKSYRPQGQGTPA
jgi:bile acid-coenzyme A ligase